MCDQVNILFLTPSNVEGEELSIYTQWFSDLASMNSARETEKKKRERRGESWDTRKQRVGNPARGSSAKVLIYLVWEILRHLIGSTHKSPHPTLGVTPWRRGLHTRASALHESWTQE